MRPRLHLELCLPRVASAASAPRRIVDAALSALGVAAACRADIALAVSEACANAIRHADGTEYEVQVVADDRRCVVTVTDAGAGADRTRLAAGPVAATATRGRGLPLMRAVSDGVEFLHRQPRGFAVRISKNLTWAETRAGSAARVHPGAADPPPAPA